MRKRAASLAVVTGLASGCFAHTTTPARTGLPEAVLGAAPLDFDRTKACGHWTDATADADAREHATFPELVPSSCFVKVRYEGDKPHPDGTPPGCGYRGTKDVVAALDRAAAIDEAVARGEPVEKMPRELACDLGDERRRAAALHNATATRALSKRLERGATYPYAAAATFGFGHPIQAASPLAHFLPDEACPSLTKREVDNLGVNVVRAARAAEAVAANVAPVMIVSGGAVHSATVEAFALTWLASCRLGLRRDRVLVNPCADHTHTNVRNTGAMIVELGGRTAYVVTDDGLQAAYLQEWTSFNLVGGSINQRALRDFGYVMGSWRQASVGLDAGFWFTPYRFYREGNPLHDFTCVAP